MAFLGQQPEPTCFLKASKVLTPESKGKQQVQDLLVLLSAASRLSELLVPTSIFLGISVQQKGKGDSITIQMHEELCFKTQTTLRSHWFLSNVRIRLWVSAYMDTSVKRVSSHSSPRTASSPPPHQPLLWWGGSYPGSPGRPHGPGSPSWPPTSVSQGRHCSPCARLVQCGKCGAPVLGFCWRWGQAGCRLRWGSQRLSVSVSASLLYTQISDTADDLSEAASVFCG